MQDDSDATLPYPVDTAEQDAQMKIRMIALIDEIVKTSRIGAWLWTITTAICVFTLGMAIHGHRTTQAILGVAGIGFGLWNIRGSRRSEEAARAWRQQWEDL